MRKLRVDAAEANAEIASPVANTWETSKTRVEFAATETPPIMLLAAEAELPEGTTETVTVAAEVVGLATMISLTTAVVAAGTVYGVV